MGSSAACSVVYLQRRAHKAGAQTCLLRLLKHPIVRQWNPVVLCAESGWLTEECRRLGITTVQLNFPSSRTLAARLIQNAWFARRVAARLRALEVRPSIIHANDHGEALLALGLAQRFSAKTALFFRSSAMTKRDYFKYRCDRFDFTAVVGPKLESSIRNWGVPNPPSPLYDGLYPEEILPPKPKPADFPNRWLVIGSPHAAKGWSDLTEALHGLQSGSKLPALHLDFTGDEPSAATNDLQLGRLTNVTTRFLGRIENFVQVVRTYDLVVNPSRSEVSGMAALEVIAAGVPLLTTKAGIVEYYQTCPRLLCEPSSAPDLAHTVGWLISNWRSFDAMISVSQKKILAELNMHDSVTTLVAEYNRLLAHA
jgi:glycosyltransferase involved in cell wall biosynthesis